MASHIATGVDFQIKSEIPATSFPEKTTTTEGNLSGRIATEIKDCFVDFGNGVVEIARKTMVYVGKLFKDSASLARVCRLGINAFSLIEKCLGQPGLFTAINTQLGTTEGLICTIGVGDQIKYFGTNKQAEESLLQNLGQGMLLVAGIGGVCVLLADVFMASFSWVADAVGSLPVFGAVAELGLGFGTVVSGIASLGFLAFACDSASKLANAVKTEEKIQAFIDLAWNISELALSIFVAVCDDWTGLLVLGTISASLGIASFVYNLYVEDREEEQKKLKLKLA